MKTSFVTMLEIGSQAILEMAGVFNLPAPGARPAGYSRTGEQVFVSDALANSSDTSAGEQFAHAYTAIVMPFGILFKKELEYLSYIAAASKAPKLFQTLDKLYNDREGETFAATILKAVKATNRHALGVVAAVKIYNNWGIMSPAQKSIIIVMLGGQTYQVEPGKALCDLKIIDGKDQVFLLSDALAMFAKGKNPYGLVENWNQIRNLCRIYNPTPTVEAVADFAQAHNLLSMSPNDAAVPGVSKTAIAATGSKPAPQYGVGALATPRGSVPPNGYTTAAKMPGGDVIVPTGNQSTAQGAFAGSLAGTKSGQDGISVNALGVYQNWDKEAAIVADKGVEGGSALLAGLINLKSTYPYMYGAMIAFITHYAGTKVPSSTANEYFASLAGIALARLVAGKKDYETDKQGAKIGSAIQSNMPSDFAKLQVDIRALYANFRVSSKADAYQLSNQAYAEERLNECDLVAMHNIFDIIYSNNGLAEIQQLMVGKDRGLEIASDKSAPPYNAMLIYQSGIHAKVLQSVQSSDIRAKNRAKYAAQQPPDNAPEEGQEPPQAAQTETAEAEAPSAPDGGAVSASV